MKLINKTGTLKFIVDNRVKKNNEKSLLRCFNNTYHDLKLESKLGDIIYNYVNIYHKQIWEQIQAIVICDEELKKGDVCYSELFGKMDWADLQLIVSEDGLEQYKKLNAKKVLAQNHHISIELINSIVSGKVKEGDEIRVVDKENNHPVNQPRKQPVEEVAKTESEDYSNSQIFSDDSRAEAYRKGFLEGAKWREKNS